MYIGLLNEYVKKTTYTHAGVSTPFAPDSLDDRRVLLKWDKVYDTAVDVNYALKDECFIGAVNVNIESESVGEIFVLVDGKVSGKFMAASPFTPDGKITVNVGVTGKNVTLRIRGDLKDITLGDTQILGSYDDEFPLLFPTPKKLGKYSNYVKIKDFKYTNDDEHAAAKYLYNRLKERYENPLSKSGVTVTFTLNPKLDRDRYIVKALNAVITVEGGSRLALHYGADTVAKLSTKRGVACAVVDDCPDFPMRGFHIGMPSTDRFEFVNNLFTYVLIPMRYNFVILELAGCMRFDSHPIITEKWVEAIERAREGKQPDMPHSGLAGNHQVIEKHEVKQFVRMARELGLEVVPEIQSLGHVQFLTYAYPEIAEIDPEKELKKVDQRDEDMPPHRFYDHCYCPSNPKSYEIMYDLIDEIIEVVEPSEYVHIGHDEVYQLGTCPVCSKKDSAKLFEDDVKKLYNHITKKGYKVMMWSDMLHPRSRHAIKGAAAVDKLPKDIVMLDFTWYFHLKDDIETELLPHGYKVGIGNLYSSHFPRYKERLSREGMIGGQTSPWVNVNENSFADHGKFFDTCLVGEMLWNKDGYIPENQRTYADIIAKHLQPYQRDGLHHTISQRGFETIAEYSLDTGDGIPAPLTGICPEAKVNDKFKIDINSRCERLVFEQATLYNAPRFEWYKFATVGTYTVHFADGTKENIDVRYAANILRWDTHYAYIMPHNMYRHHGYVGTWYADPAVEGKTCDGKDMLITGLVWENPHPTKKVKKVTYKRAENDCCRLIFKSVKVQKNNDFWKK